MHPCRSLVELHGTVADCTSVLVVSVDARLRRLWRGFGGVKLGEPRVEASAGRLAGHLCEAPKLGEDAFHAGRAMDDSWCGEGCV